MVILLALLPPALLLPPWRICANNANFCASVMLASGPDTGIPASCSCFNSTSTGALIISASFLTAISDIKNSPAELILPYCLQTTAHEPSLLTGQRVLRSYPLSLSIRQ